MSRGDAAKSLCEILVVDDEPYVLRVLRSILEYYGYRVLVASDAVEALAVFRARPEIDLLIADVVMPGMNGPDLADALLEINPRLRVLFTAGMPDTPLIQSVVERGFAFLPKPYPPAVLLGKVREVLGSSASA
jgi:CheY-like chemotaxis protein